MVSTGVKMLRWTYTYTIVPVWRSVSTTVRSKGDGTINRHLGRGVDFAPHVRDEDNSSPEYDDIYGTQEPEAKLDGALFVLGGCG